jgi:L-aspartate oxidase
VAEALEPQPEERRRAARVPDELLAGAGASVPEELAERTIAALRAQMWDEVGLVRDAHGLEHALARLEELGAALPDGRSDAHTLLLAGTLVARAALARRESRGSHYRADFPVPDPAFAQRQIVSPALPAAASAC